MFFNLENSVFFTSFYTFYAQHRHFCIRDKDVFTTVCCKKMKVKNINFSKSPHEIRLFFFKKSDFYEKILWYFLFCQNSVSIWNWSRYMSLGCFPWLSKSHLDPTPASSYPSILVSSQDDNFWPIERILINFCSKTFPRTSSEINLCRDTASKGCFLKGLSISYSRF